MEIFCDQKNAPQLFILSLDLDSCTVSVGYPLILLQLRLSILQFA